MRCRHVPSIRLQWLRVPLEVLPAVDRAGVDLLAHLHRACGGAGGRVFSRTQAGRLEVQPEPLEQPSGLAPSWSATSDSYSISIRRLAQQSRQCRQQPIVRNVITAEVLERVGEPEVGLLVHGETSVHRVAPQVDEPGVGHALAMNPGYRKFSGNFSMNKGWFAEPVGDGIQVAVGDQPDVLWAAASIIAGFMSAAPSMPLTLTQRHLQQLGFRRCSSIREWLPRMRSVKVVPVRGRPTMKIGCPAGDVAVATAPVLPASPHRRLR